MYVGIGLFAWFWGVLAVGFCCFGNLGVYFAQFVFLLWLRS
jgi:hypothetical protein